MSITLTVTDNQDGTGAVATVGGVDPASAVTLYRGAFAGGLGIVQWLPAGTRTGDGAIPVDLAVAGAAYFFWYAEAAGALSPVVYQCLTDGAASVDDRIVDAVVAGIQALTLPGVGEVARDDTFISLENRVVPLILVTGFGEQETDLQGTAGRDDLGYPTKVALVTADKFGVPDDRVLRLWRHRIGTYFRSQRLAGVPEVWHCGVEAGAISDTPQADNRMFRTSLLTLRHKARIRRGMGA